MCQLFQRFSVLSAFAAEQRACLLWKRAYGENLQLSGALRSFYFLVHPDFFSRQPHMRATNEESLKVLQRYYLDLESPGCSPRPMKGLKFFVRPTGATRESFREISIDLVDTNPRLLVKSLLTKCNLPDRVPMEKAAPARKRSDKDLMEWMSTLSAQAEERGKKADLADDQNVRLIERLCSKYKLRDILWNDHFSRELFLPSLNSLQRALDCFPEVLPRLSGWKLKFGNSNCVSAGGNVVLNPLDVSERWLGVLDSLAHCRDISRQVASASQEGRCVFRWLDQCEQLIDRLKRSNVNIHTDQRYHMLDAVLMGQSECNLCVTSSGLLLIPGDVSPARMEGFLKSKVDRAIEAQRHFQATVKEMGQLKRRIVDKYSLRMLTVDDSGSLDGLTASLRRFLRIDESASERLRGQRLHLAGSAYSVLWDGRIVVPLDWH